MRVIPKPLFDMGVGIHLRSEVCCREYDGELALSDRGQSTAAFNQSSGQSAADQAAATQADESTNNELNTYKSNLAKFMNFGQQTYGPNGTYMADQNAISNDVAHATANGLTTSMALNAARTGENTASYAPAAAAAKQQGQLDMTSQLATADANRLQALTGINQYGVQASALPAQVQASLYGPSVSGSTGQIDAATGAAKTPSTADVISQDVIGAGADIASGFCPCEGSMILLEDGSDMRAELLEATDKLKSFPKQAANPLTAKPVPRLQECYEIQLDRGWFHRGSATHTVALEGGGYAYMTELKGKSVLTIHGPKLVTSVEPIGEKWVVPLSVGGSHAYIADGLFCLA